ncbi:diaminohydroxyphosphoribosylaminopyrimidine deaminase [Thermoactinomyces sp. DSM 45891]|uniref:bifunctional diaminohydroxyphosphoribosylaminopyrimidine deaminase/5-amino-6-(5-phosphoribosylamino)uracil reductase RibD n=1 Tax=Thermoactinomyces sp. DSM 45891 TaxID=1761907 RepID=UPI00091DC8B4|nr:bifunctional diaminohydroxyphosphoribosylaminopyrimidine deaminase/5-amino-6-(5-phosphoribosylamino)uracil reductase RibD [Thermoactinomyces sp. DSM 45891]SFX07197.1 diaminohydroxyphosphoribosylaminopyrimidine deaminase [Thermoactinomyces sp. DSM 45891]
MTDLQYMLIAIEEGRKAQGKTGTNPPVGAIVVKDGEIVGRGHTSHLGGPHAEVNALADAGDKAKGATVYCTLEPCAHYGRTGPCCVALTDAGVARVVVGIGDPYEQVNGKGIDHLRESGVEVSLGYCEGLIKEDLKDFLEYIKEKTD